MEDNKTTQPNVEDTQKEGNVGTQPTATQVEKKKEEIKTYSQEDLDNNAANTRRATERETKKKLFAQLGLTLDEEDKLNAFKQAFEASLSDEEKRNAESENLQADKVKLTQDLEEKDYVIKALIQLTGKNEEDVDKIVKMAKGLKTEENTIEEAIKEVIDMVKPKEITIPAQQVVENPNMPKGQEIQQPSTVSVDLEDNPFKKGASFNLTRQGQLIRTNPELAKKLASEAGVRITI